MKPLRLELEGWARFRERQVISFEDLTLFAIAGPTGAGKTLILDAICFALFGVTPRLSQKLESLVSSEADRLAVELQFEVAAGIHRVVRSIELKASGNASKSIRVERLEDGRWKLVPETDRLKAADERLEQLVGFDFRSFTRSILLPQGQFDEFLHGDARLRRTLLKELLDLGRVERMREEASKRERSDSTRLAGIQARLEAGALEQAPVRLRALRQELEALEQADAGAREQLERLRAELQQAREVTELHEALRRLAPELSEKKAAQERAPQLRRELEEGRKAAALAPLLRLHAQLSSQLETGEAELEKLTARLPRLQEQAEEAGRAAEAASNALVAQEAGLKARIAKLHGLLPLAGRLQRLGGAPQGLAGDPAAWDEERLNRLLSLEERLGSLEVAGRRATRLEERSRQLETEAAAAEKERDRLTERLDALLREGTQAASRVDEAARLVVTLQQSGGDTASSLRRSLQVGGTCPVCGQPVHDLPHETGPELAAAREELKKREDTRNELREQYQQARTALAGLTERLKANSDARCEARDSLADTRHELEQLLTGFSEAGLAGTPDEIAGALRRETAAQLAAAGARLSEAAGGGDAAEAVAELERQLSALQEAERKSANALTQARHNLELARGQLEMREQEQETRRAEAQQQRSELDAQLRAAGFADDAALESASREPERLSQLEELLERGTRELEALLQREADLKERLAGRADRPQDVQSLQEQLDELERLQAEALQRRGSLEAGIRQERKLADELSGLLKERREVEDSRDVWKVLARDLQDNNFTDFLLAGMQQLLARRASSIIRKVTDGRFDLHLSGTREFEVSDAWAGGTRRSVRSLSGGETFIVSLALALALSDAAAGGRRLGALFLDEGFGTLDAETLDSVAGVLESLSTDGRMVGIITHVTELSERLPARLLIRKEAEGSTAYWED